MSTPGGEYKQPVSSVEKQRDVSGGLTSLLKKWRNRFVQHSDEELESQGLNLGEQILRANKDVSRFTRNVLWRGHFSDFIENNKRSPTAIIESHLNSNMSYAFRAVGPNEFAQIILSEGIGGPDYKGSVVTEVTLFSTDLAAPLAMMDGRTYGGDDDRSRGGYIVVVENRVAVSHLDTTARKSTTSGDPILLVVTKIPLADVHAVFGISRNMDPNDIEAQYEIYQIVPKTND